MIHIVTSQNRHLYQSHLWAAQTQRPALGVDRTGWVDLTSRAPEPLDGAVDLLAFDDRMDLEAGLRLVPGDAGREPAESFAALGAAHEPSWLAPDVWCVARLFTTEVLRARTPAGRDTRMLELWTASLELALTNAVASLVGLIDMTLHPSPLQASIGLRLVGPPRPQAQGVIARAELSPSMALLTRLRASVGLEGPTGYHVDDLDLRAFGDLAAVQNQVIRAQIPQAPSGSARDEALAAETLFRLNDLPGQARRGGPRGAGLPLRELNA